MRSCWRSRECNRRRAGREGGRGVWSRREFMVGGAGSEHKDVERRGSLLTSSR